MNLTDKKSKTKGWISLSPLLVFLVVYVISSIAAGDFYGIPIASAFLIASIYALAVCCKGPVRERVEIFSKGAGEKNVLLMLWIFILAGAFAGSAKEIGSIDATVNATLAILPGKMIFAGLFIASCFISMTIGTSVGTIVALVPIASGIAAQTGSSPAMMTAIIVGGAFFGDNLSFISDTTIASTKTQGCSMSDKFKVNLWIAAPAALIVTVIYVILGMNTEFSMAPVPANMLLILPYILVIVLAVCGMDVLAVLATGLGANALISIFGDTGWIGFLKAVGSGIAGMGDRKSTRLNSSHT